MKILAIDTSTDACSAALFCDDTVTTRFEIAPRRHTELILPMADALLAEAGLAVSQLDAIAFGRGPGAFTGVRIAAGVAQGIALGADLPVIPVSTLATMAQQVIDEAGGQAVAAALDARMGEVYWGAFQTGDDGVAEAALPETVAAPGEVTLPVAGQWIGAGGGWAAYGETLAERFGNSIVRVLPEITPAAAFMRKLAIRAYAHGEVLPAEQAQPVYLRDQVAKKPGQGKS